MRFLKIFQIIFVLFFNDVANCANILGIFPGPTRSALSVAKVILHELAARGHQITVISPFKIGGNAENITDIQLDGVQQLFLELGLTNVFNKSNHSPIEETTNLIYGTAELADLTLKNQEVQKLLRSDATFDLLILHAHMTDSLLGIANHYQIPSIILSTTGSTKYTDEVVGNPFNPSYVPHLFVGFMDHMSFKERLINSLVAMFDEITYRYFYIPSQEAIYHKHFNDLKPKHQTELPSLIDLIHNVSLVFVNTHSSLHLPRPMVPNMIDIGGVHIQEETGLTSDIDQFIKEAERGVIYFSMGGQIKSKDLPAEKREAFVKVFSSMPGIRVLCKWENATLPDQGFNTVIGPWMPQQDILAHPNVKLFITHGGALSTLEAVNFAVPMVGIPMFGEQNTNMAIAQKHGYARILDYNNITEESVREAIEDVLTNPKYQESIDRISPLLRDNLTPQLEKTIYHIEYVLRTNGARHLRSGSIQLSLYQYLLIDVGAVIILGIFLILLVPSIIIGIILRKTNSTPEEAGITSNGTTANHTQSSRRGSNNSKNMINKKKKQ